MKMKRTLGTLAAGMGLALLTVVMFANGSGATGAPADFDAVAAEVDSAIAAFDAQDLKKESYFLTTLGKVKTGVLSAKGKTDSKRNLGIALRKTGTIIRGIKSRLTNNNARKQIPADVREPLVALLETLKTHVAALK